MQEQSASVISVQEGVSALTDKELCAEFTGRETDANWSPNLHVQSPLAGLKGFTAVHENKKTVGSGAGVVVVGAGGRQWKEVAFLWFICKADQTDTGCRSSLLGDEPGWAGGSTD